MRHRTELHGVIEQLYRAATGSVDVTWECALADVKRVVQGHEVTLCEVDMPRRELVFHVGAGDAPPTARHAYKKHFHLCDPMLKRLHRTTLGRWVHCNELFDDAFVASDPFYQEYLLPNGGRWVSGIKLATSDDRAFSLMVTRRAELGPLAGDDFLACDLLSFHIAKAYAFAQLHAQLKRQHAAAELALQHVGSPIFMLDGECRLLFSNQLARSLLSSGSVFSESEGRIVLTDARDDRVIRALVATLFREADGYRFPASAYLSFAASEHDGIARSARTCVLGMMLILLRDQGEAASGACPVLLAVTHELKDDPKADPNVLVRAFGLTKAEAAVAICVAQGVSVGQIATEHGRAVSTVRSQVKSVLAKMHHTMMPVRFIPFIFLGTGSDYDDGTASVLSSPRKPPPGWPHVSDMPLQDRVD